jgi:hypothetical protein
MNGPQSDEYLKLVNQADQLREELKNQRERIGRQFRQLHARRRWWQTFVVISTSISTGLAGYMAQQDIPIVGRFGLAVVVALSGAVAAIRDAWQVNEALDDAKGRYSEVRELAFELEKARYDAEGSAGEEDRLSKFGPAVRHVQTMLDNLSDDLIESRKKT